MFSADFRMTDSSHSWVTQRGQPRFPYQSTMPESFNYSLFTLHYSLRARVLIGALVLPLFLSSLPQSAAIAQEPPPLVVDADQVVYADATQTVEATGNVSLSYRGIGITSDSTHVKLHKERVAARGTVVARESTVWEPPGGELED